MHHTHEHDETSANTSTKHAQACATAQWDRCTMRIAQKPPTSTPAVARGNGPAMVATSISSKACRSTFIHIDKA